VKKIKYGYYESAYNLLTKELKSKIDFNSWKDRMLQQRLLFHEDCNVFDVKQKDKDTTTVGCGSSSNTFIAMMDEKKGIFYKLTIDAVKDENGRFYVNGAGNLYDLIR
jgi:hypothetical protein